MATLDELIVRIKADASQLEREMKKATDIADRAGKSIGGSMTSASAGVGLLTGKFAALVALASALAGGAFVGTITSFEKINASLRTVTGSVGAAADAFSMIQAFAATTPYSVEQVAEAFIKLKALGLDPSEESLRSYGNTATAMGKMINQMIEAVADASTGEFERLKEFGIKTKDAGDSVEFTFQGMTTTVKKNAAEIEDYLRRIGEVNFGDAMAEQQGTLNAALSNAGDSFAKLAQAIGDSGVTNVLIDITSGISDLAAKVAEEIPKIVDKLRLLVGEYKNVSEGAIRGESVNNQAKIGQSRSRLNDLQSGDSYFVKDDTWGLANRADSIQMERAKLQRLLDRQAQIQQTIGQFDAAYDSGAEYADDYGAERDRTSTFGKGKKEKKVKVDKPEDYDEKGDALSEYIAKQQQEYELTQLSGKALAVRRAELEATNIAIRDGNLPSQEMLETIKSTAGATYEAEAALKKLNDAQEAAARFNADLKDRFSDTFSSIILNVKSAGDALGQFAEQMAKLVIEKKITGPLTDSLGSLIDNSDIGKSVGGFFGDLFGGARASGGPVANGLSYLVGEKGPEIFTPSASGYITPNHKLGGGMNFVQNNNFASGLTRSEVAGMIPSIVAASKNAVMDAVQRGGTDTRAFRGA